MTASLVSTYGGHWDSQYVEMTAGGDYVEWSVFLTQAQADELNNNFDLDTPEELLRYSGPFTGGTVGGYTVQVNGKHRWGSGGTTGAVNGSTSGTDIESSNARWHGIGPPGGAGYGGLGRWAAGTNKIRVLNTRKASGTQGKLHVDFTYAHNGADPGVDSGTGYSSLVPPGWFAGHADPGPDISDTGPKWLFKATSGTLGTADSTTISATATRTAPWTWNVSATVSKTTGSGTPTGQVEFYSANTNFTPVRATLNGSGVGTFTLDLTGRTDLVVYPSSYFNLRVRYLGDSTCDIYDRLAAQLVAETPTPTFTYSGRLETGYPITFSSTMTWPGSGSTIFAPTTWNYNDGQTAGAQITVIHAFANPGTYNVTTTRVAMATSSTGHSAPAASYAVVLVITGSAIAAAFSWNPFEPFVDVAADLIDQSTGQPGQWTWEFTDPNNNYVATIFSASLTTPHTARITYDNFTTDAPYSGDAQNPSFLMNVLGVWSVLLTARWRYNTSSGTGYTRTVSHTITVVTPPPPPTNTGVTNFRWSQPSAAAGSDPIMVSAQFTSADMYYLGEVSSSTFVNVFHSYVHYVAETAMRVVLFTDTTYFGAGLGTGEVRIRLDNGHVSDTIGIAVGTRGTLIIDWIPGWAVGDVRRYFVVDARNVTGDPIVVYLESVALISPGILSGATTAGASVYAARNP